MSCIVLAGIIMNTRSLFQPYLSFIFCNGVNRSWNDMSLCLRELSEVP